jgi:hypothetical protein
VPETPIPDSVASLIRTCVTSVWTLELLLFLKQHETTVWSVDQLVRELRGSRPLVVDLALALHRSGLVEQVGESYRYQPRSDDLRSLVEQLERLSVERPLAVRSAILAAPHDKVQVFADAFRIKKG